VPRGATDPARVRNVTLITRRSQVRILAPPPPHPHHTTLEQIRRAGVVKPWPADAPEPRYHHTYLEVDGWDYWTMGATVEETTVINRARLKGSASSPGARASGRMVAGDDRLHRAPQSTRRRPTRQVVRRKTLTV
jgi:hypothetical protein